MRICGVQGVSAIDFPGRIASVIFLGGCNFRCPFCHNPELVQHPLALQDLSIDDMLGQLERRSGLIDGVVVTGGEPLIHGRALLDLLRRLHDAGLAVKLDTNGYETDMLRQALSSGSVDFLAMDVKTSPGKYAKATGRTMDVQPILDSIAAMQEAGIRHEFRTTCVPGLVELDDVMIIASLLGPQSNYVLQQYRTGTALLDPTYQKLKPHAPEAMKAFATAASSLAGNVSLRGV